MEAAATFWELANALMAEDPRVVEGTIMKGRCLRVGAEFLALCDYKGSGLVVKLTTARVAELIEAGRGQPFAPAGRVFAEWVSVPRVDRARRAALLREGVALAAGEQPKKPGEPHPEENDQASVVRDGVMEPNATFGPSPH